MGHLCLNLASTMFPVILFTFKIKEIAKLHIQLFVDDIYIFKSCNHHKRLLEYILRENTVFNYLLVINNFLVKMIQSKSYTFLQCTVYVATDI